MSRADVLASFEAIANRVTYHRAKAEAMGFKFERVTLRDDFSVAGVRLDAPFSCVCGRRERLVSILRPTMPKSVLTDLLDPVATLWGVGAFSREHLLADGYTSEQIDEFERRAAEFDKAFV